MTNSEAKQEAIKKAYNKYDNCYESLKDRIDKNGYVNINFIESVKYPFRHFRSTRVNGAMVLAPVEVFNIQSNNGWIRIEPDGSNFPKNNKFYKVFAKEYSNGSICDDPARYDTDRGFWRFKSGFAIDATVTHYKPIKEEPKPVY